MSRLCEKLKGVYLSFIYRVYIERIFFFEVSPTTLSEAEAYMTSYDLMILNNDLERTVTKRPIEGTEEVHEISQDSR
jgi:hypothetical protein